MTSLKIATWNVNGLAPNKHEVEVLINVHKLDILLISETHFTDQSLINIPNYNIYATNHPDGTAHGGTAVIIRKSIQHHQLPGYMTEHILATTICIHDKDGNLNVSAVYCPPKHKMTEELFTLYFDTLGTRFLAGGDWNCKYTHWGSRLITTRGRELKETLDKKYLTVIATPEPTHWPTDPKRLPDLLDFFISKSLSCFTNVESCLDGSSNHIPVILTVSNSVLFYDKKPKLYNKLTDWSSFRDVVQNELHLKISLKCADDIDSATENFTLVIQNACWRCTPETVSDNIRQQVVPIKLREEILEKRRLRRVWHTSRHPSDKAKFNKAVKDLKESILDAHNATTEAFVESLTPTASTNYSLWRTFKSRLRPLIPKPPLRGQGTEWLRTESQKADAFAEHLAKTFTPNPKINGIDDSYIHSKLQQDHQLDLPLQPTTPKELIKNIKMMDNRKAPGFDLIDKKVLQELPRKAIVFLTNLFNAIMRVSYFPAMWKVSQIIMILKPGKPVHDITSYRPISLLPVISKLFEKIFLFRLLKSINERSIIPKHQFGFRSEHATIEQIHRVCNVIRSAYECKQYCSSAFLDVHQAFDKVWHTGLLFKIKTLLPHTFYSFLESYLSETIFQIKEGSATSTFYDVHAGVPQGSVLGPILYTIFTSDLPEIPGVTVATFADDTSIMVKARCPKQASEILQNQLDEIGKWLEKWRIKVNTIKSSHVTFTLRKDNCPPVTLNGHPLPHSDSVKYLGMHLDRRLTWRKHIRTKRDELNLKYKGLYWLLGRNSKLSLGNKLLIYKTVLKPIWSYGMQLWGSACDSSIQMIQRAQNNILNQMANSPWFIKINEVHEHLAIHTVKNEIKFSSSKYKTRLLKHPNPLATQLIGQNMTSRLKRRHILQTPQ